MGLARHWNTFHRKKLPQEPARYDILPSTANLSSTVRHPFLTPPSSPSSFLSFPTFLPSFFYLFIPILSFFLFLPNFPSFLSSILSFSFLLPSCLLTFLPPFFHPSLSFLQLSFHFSFFLPSFFFSSFLFFRFLLPSFLPCSFSKFLSFCFFLTFSSAESKFTLH